MKRVIFLFMAALSVLSLSFAKVALADTYTITGVVKNGSGSPVVGASIYSSLDSNTTVTTDPTGTYSLPVSGGYQDIRVTPPVQSGLSSAIAKNQNVTANSVLNFTLTNGSVVSFSGHVNNQFGVPLSNQSIIISSTTQTIATATTNSSGYFYIEVSPGSYKVDITNFSDQNKYAKNNPGYYNITLGTNFQLTQSVLLDINLPSYKTTAHVVDKFGIAVANATIATSMGNWSGTMAGVNSTGQSRYSKSATTDAAGNVDLYLFPGQYTFTLNPPAGSTGLVTTVVSGVTVGQSATQDFTINSPLTLSGVITDASGTPLPNQTVTVSTTTATVASTNTNAQGAYSLNVNAGTYKVDVTNFSHQNDFALHVPGYYNMTVSTNFSMQNDRTLNLAVPAKKVDVRVKNQNGTIVAGAKVRTAAATGWTGVDVGGYSTTGTARYSTGPATDLLGNATLWLIPTTYSLAIEPPTGSPYSLTTHNGVSISSDTSLSLEIAGTVTLVGTVTDSYGSPVPHQTVNLSTLSETVASIETDANGSYQLNVAPDTYKLNINNVSHQADFSLRVPDHYDINVESNFTLNSNTTLNIALPFKEVSVHVQGPSNEPVANMAITTTNGGWSGAVGQNTSSGNSGYTHPASTDSSGNATFWLLTSTYDFIATPPSGSPYATGVIQNIVINSDQTQIISLQLNTPTAPTNLIATSPTQEPSLSWGEVGTASSYSIYRDGSYVGSSTLATFADITATEGQHDYYVTAVNPNGESQPSNTITVLVDKTLPDIYFTFDQPTNGLGWATHPVTVTFHCSDALSGVESCSPPHYETSEGATVVTGTVVDNAGNSQSINAVMMIDTVNPTISYDLSPAVNSGGWNNGDVTITYNCGDGTSGVSICPEPETVSTDTFTTLVRAATDNAGNTQSVNVPIMLDKTTPTIDFTLSPLPNSQGWSSEQVSVTFICDDPSVSGVSSGVKYCSQPETVTQDGAIVVTGYVEDNAGNTNAVNVVVYIDNANPTISSNIAPNPNVSGWNNSDATVNFTCNDILSGILSCDNSHPETYTADGTFTATGTATDNAGNTISATQLVKLDKSAPLQGMPSWTANPMPVNTSTSVSLSVVDATSGINKAEYFVGTTDPGLGNATPMTIANPWVDTSTGAVTSANLTATMGSGLQTGIYTVTFRTMDFAGNWSVPNVSYLVVFDPSGPTDVAASKKSVPKLANGDVLPGLQSDSQNGQANVAFDVSYDTSGNIIATSNLALSYASSQGCNHLKPGCTLTSFTASTTSPEFIAWLTINGQNNSIGTFQGIGTLAVETDQGTTTTNNPFSIVAVDGSRTAPTSPDSNVLNIYAPGANPSVDSPLYQYHLSANGNWVKIQ